MIAVLAVTGLVSFNFRSFSKKSFLSIIRASELDSIYPTIQGVWVFIAAPTSRCLGRRPPTNTMVD